MPSETTLERDARIKAISKQKEIDVELKKLRRAQKRIKDKIEELETQFNRLGVDNNTAIYPFAPLY